MAGAMDPDGQRLDVLPQCPFAIEHNAVRDEKGFFPGRGRPNRGCATEACVLLELSDNRWLGNQARATGTFS
jgi:hypothetical protein